MITLLSVLGRHPKLIKALPLFDKYKGATLSDLSLPMLRELTEALEMKVANNDRVLSEVVAMLQSDDINNLADLANNPETISKLMDWFSNHPDDTESSLPSLGQFYGALSAEDLL